MKYQELLERFWDMDKDFSCAEITLYLYLLHRCNSYGWPDTFSLSNEELIERLKCSRNTIRAARNTLVEAGLVCFHSDHGRGNASSYSIVTEATEKGQNVTLLSEEEEQEKGQNMPLLAEKGSKCAPFSVKSDRKRVNHRPFLAKSPPLKEEKKTFPPAPPIKEKKKSAHTISAHTPMCANGQFTLFSEEAPPLKKKRNPVEPHLPKDIEEVVTFFEKYASDKLPEWKAEAELFFYHFDSVGWMGTSNRQIQDWESRANLWISDKALALKNGEQERRQTEIDARNLRPYGRTTGVPKEGGGGKMLPQSRVRECNEQDDTPKDYTKGF